MGLLDDAAEASLRSRADTTLPGVPVEAQAAEPTKMDGMRHPRLTAAALALSGCLAIAGCTSTGSSTGASSGSGTIAGARATESPTPTPTPTPTRLAGHLPQVGEQVFPGRRMVALYGHPGTAGLGVLGEQGLQASITRAKKVAAQYESLSSVPVLPTFEIIATVALGSPGENGTYTKVWDPKLFEPWVEAAEKAGVYVILDLQPGRERLLSQAKAYEELLKRPNVGLAIDPEWKLGPNEKPLRKIGSVKAEEVNEVSSWLAALTKENELPQKVFVLHQFRISMLPDRHAINTSHPELAMVIHADGQGTQGMKRDTWTALRQNAPKNVWWGWKNFHDEDKPMLKPGQTMQVSPAPYLITYQ